MKWIVLAFATIGQAAAASICVTVMDMNQAVIPGAAVSVTPVKGGETQKRAVKTDGVGKVCIASLRERKYYVEVRSEWFIPVRYEVYASEKEILRLPFLMLVDPSVSYGHEVRADPPANR